MTYYLNQCSLIVNWPPRNILKWNVNGNSNTFIYANEFKKVGNRSAIMSRSPVSWWRHQMETFSALLALCAGNSRVLVNSPHKGQWRGALMFSLICARINDWVTNREAGDLRRHRGHYDVIVMVLTLSMQGQEYSREIRASSRYKDPSFPVWYLHYKDKTVVRPSYPYNGNSYIGKTASW